MTTSARLHVAAGSFDRFLSCSPRLSSRAVADEIEPLDETSNEYRQASKQALAFIYYVVEFLSSYRNEEELEIRFWAVASALQLGFLRSAKSLSFAGDSLCRNGRKDQEPPLGPHLLSGFRNSVQRSADNPHADSTIWVDICDAFKSDQHNRTGIGFKSVKLRLQLGDGWLGWD